MTPLLEQAQKWCLKFKNKGKAAIVSVYEFDETAFEHCSVLRLIFLWVGGISACKGWNIGYALYE